MSIRAWILRDILERRKFVFFLGKVPTVIFDVVSAVFIHTKRSCLPLDEEDKKSAAGKLACSFHKLMYCFLNLVLIFYASN